jgi:hypothetical protein
VTRTIEIPANRPEIFLEVKRRTSDVRAAILPVLMEFKRAHQRGEKRSFKKTIIWPRSMVMMDEVMGIIREVLDDVMSVCFMDAMVINYHAASPAFGKQRILIQLLDPDGDVYILVASPALGTGTDLTSTTLDSHVFYDLVGPHSNRLSVCLSICLSSYVYHSSSLAFVHSTIPWCLPTICPSPSNLLSFRLRAFDPPWLSSQVTSSVANDR